MSLIVFLHDSSACLLCICAVCFEHVCAFGFFGGFFARAAHVCVALLREAHRPADDTQNAL